MKAKTWNPILLNKSLITKIFVPEKYPLKKVNTVATPINNVANGCNTYKAASNTYHFLSLSAFLISFKQYLDATSVNPCIHLLL